MLVDLLLLGLVAFAGAAGGLLYACWRLRNASAGGPGFMASLRAVLRTGGQGEER